MRVVLTALVGMGLLLAACGGGPSAASPTAVAPATPTSTVGASATVPATATAVPAAPPTPLAVITLTPLEEGSTITEDGVYVAEVNTRKVWKVGPLSTFLWAADGKSLALIGQAGLDVLDLATSSLARIFDRRIESLAWSPDGNKMAFSPFSDGRLYLINRDGSGLTEVAGSFGSGVQGWSPTGDYLALRPGPNVVILDVATGGTKEFDATGLDWGGWSPNGTALAFTSNSGVYIYDVYSGQRRQVAFGPSFGPVVWSPDGTRLAFKFGPPVPLADDEKAFQIYYVLDIQTGAEPRPLPPARSVSWSPDGTRLAYLSEGCITRNWDIYSVKPDGSSEVRLTNTPDAVKEGPYWSPDGSTMAFSTLDRLVTLDVDSGEETTVAVSAAGLHLHTDPWSADGGYLAFLVGGGHGVCD